jgi:2-dehydro-3-deoxyphosphogalactonate aldolase
MQIERVQTFVVGVPPPFHGGVNWLFVKLTTNDGVEGWGECNGSTFREKTLTTLVHEVCEHFIVGKHNPFDTETLWGKLFGGDGTSSVKNWTNWRHSGAFSMQVAAAIDMACWDIVGKSLGQPVYNLIGGKYRDKLRCYTYMYGWAAGQSPSKAGETAAKLRDRGFTALKFDPIPPYFPQPRDVSLKELRYTEAVMTAVRDSVGDDCDILMGTHGQLTTHSAIRFAEVIEPYRPLWFEEPVPPENAAEMARVARATSIPIATGERLSTRWDFQPLLEQQAAQVLQVNIGLNGILESKKIAAMAEASYAQIAPWIYCGPVAGAASIHLDVSTPNFLIQEGIDDWSGFSSEIMRDPIVWDRGYIVPNPKPGLGADLDESVLARYPMNEYSDLRQRGSTDWYASKMRSG